MGEYLEDNASLESCILCSDVLFRGDSYNGKFKGETHQDD